MNTLVFEGKTYTYQMEKVGKNFYKESKMDRKLTVTSARDFVMLQAGLRMLDHNKQLEIEKMREWGQDEVARALTEQRTHIAGMLKRWTAEYVEQK